MFSIQYIKDFKETIVLLSQLEPKNECRFKKILTEFNCLVQGDKEKLNKEFPDLKNKLICKVAASKGVKVKLYQRTLCNLAERHPRQFAEYDPKARSFSFKINLNPDPKARTYVHIDPKKTKDPKCTLDKVASFGHQFMTMLNVLSKILKVVLQVMKIIGKATEAYAIITA